MRRVTQVRADTSGAKIVPRNSMSRLVVMATRSAWARPICLGTSSPKTMVNRVSRTVTTMRARPFAVDGSTGRTEANQAPTSSTRLTAAKAEARKPRKLMPIWMTARKRPGLALRRWTRTAFLLPSSTSCWRRLRRIVTRAISVAEKMPLSEHEDDDQAEFQDGAAHEGASSPAGLDRISRIRAGTPTASLPAGTSRVTTEPAPVLAPAPMSRGATIIVSTPMNAPSPMVVRCLRVPS